MPIVVPSPLHSKRWMEGSPMQFEQHLLRVGLKHSVLVHNPSVTSRHGSERSPCWGRP